MRIEFENIVLRDMIKSDIEDYVRWFTLETQWMEFDAPWENEDETYDEETERKNWSRLYDAVKDKPDGEIRRKFEIEYEGRHVGWVSTYLFDVDCEWMSVNDIKEGEHARRAVGIDICESELWGHGIGTAALRAFINYYFERGTGEIYTQTWSGNERMIRCAEKLGFAEFDRRVGEREVNGRKYDALTFILKKEQ